MAISYRRRDKPTEIWHAGANRAYLSGDILAIQRTPGGHPEGYLEAFGNIYRNFALTLLAKLAGEKATKEMLDFPGVNDGIRGMAFIDTVVKSNTSDTKWTDFVV